MRCLQQVAALQEWRWTLLVAAHLDAASADPAALSQHLEPLVFVWLRLRKCVAALAAADPDSPVAQKAQQAAAQLDATLGLAGGAVAKPRLWKRGGRPLLPKAAELAAGSNRLLALAGCTRVGAQGYAPDHRGQAEVLSAAGLGVSDMPVLEDADAAPVSSEELAAAAAACVASDVELRRAVLDGASLFEAASLLAGRDADASLPELLAGEVRGAALLAARRALEIAASMAVPEGEEPGPARAPSAVLVPALRALGDAPLQPYDALPRLLPAGLMVFEPARALQMELLAVEDHAASAALLELLAGPAAAVLPLLREGYAGPRPAAAQLQAAVQAVVCSGCRSVAEAAPYQLLQWLADAGEGGGGRWGQLLPQSLAHEAWFRWHQGLWAGASSVAPAGSRRGGLGPAAAQRWASMQGPMRLHTSTLSAHASALATASDSPISSHDAKVVQLKMAARQLKSRAAGGQGGYPAVARAEWRAALLVATSTLAAYAADLPAEAPAALAAAAEARSPGELLPSAGAWLAAVAGALEGCAHPLLRALAQPVVLPALEALLAQEATEASPAGERRRGRNAPFTVLLRSTQLHFSPCMRIAISHLGLALPCAQAWRRAARSGRCSAWPACTCRRRPRAPTRLPSTRSCGGTP
jgi:hypothetical protein